TSGKAAGEAGRRRCERHFFHIYQGLALAEAALTCRKGAFAEDLPEEGKQTKSQRQIGPMEAAIRQMHTKCAPTKVQAEGKLLDLISDARKALIAAEHM